MTRPEQKRMQETVATPTRSTPELCDRRAVEGEGGVEWSKCQRSSEPIASSAERNRARVP